MREVQILLIRRPPEVLGQYGSEGGKEGGGGGVGQTKLVYQANHPWSKAVGKLVLRLEDADVHTEKEKVSAPFQTDFS